MRSPVCTPREIVTEARASPGRWLLVETFGGTSGQPSVIAKGRNAVGMVPLESLMRKSRYAPEVLAVVLRAASEGAPARAVSGDRQRGLAAVPLGAVGGRVHGVHVWIGGPGEQPPARCVAGAWCLSLTSGRLDVADEVYELYGVRPGDRARPRLVLAEAFGRLLPSGGEGRALGVLVRGRPGEEYQGSWAIRRDDGHLRRVTISCRTITQPLPGGRAGVVTRGIMHDAGPGGSTAVPDPPSLERQVLMAGQRPGAHRVIVHLRHLRALWWIDRPLSGLACTGGGRHGPAIHPDDLPSARRMAGLVAAGDRAEGTLRLRGGEGGWMRVGVAASKVLLDQDTSAALVTLSAD